MQIGPHFEIQQRCLPIAKQHDNNLPNCVSLYKFVIKIVSSSSHLEQVDHMLSGSWTSSRLTMLGTVKNKTGNVEALWR